MGDQMGYHKLNKSYHNVYLENDENLEEEKQRIQFDRPQTTKKPY